MDKAIITAALTGPIAGKADNPALPGSPVEIAESAKGAFEAGAAVEHIHLRDERGERTADLDVARRTVELVREACPAIIQISTGVSLETPYEERMKLVEVRPAMASLNPCTMTFGPVGAATGPRNNGSAVATIQRARRARISSSTPAWEGS
jgi:uncharacterized protein (DUF849 family)